MHFFFELAYFGSCRCPALVRSILLYMSQSYRAASLSNIMRIWFYDPQLWIWHFRELQLAAEGVGFKGI